MLTENEFWKDMVNKIVRFHNWMPTYLSSLTENSLLNPWIGFKAKNTALHQT